MKITKRTMFNFQELDAFEICTFAVFKQYPQESRGKYYAKYYGCGEWLLRNKIKMQVHQKRGKIESFWVLDSTIRPNRRVYVRCEWEWQISCNSTASMLAAAPV